MYAKMMYTNILVNQIKGDKYKKKAAKEELWKGQNSYAYWHGQHKGIYTNKLRKEIYRSLIEAERITRGPGRTGVMAAATLGAGIETEHVLPGELGDIANTDRFRTRIGLR